MNKKLLVLMAMLFVMAVPAFADNAAITASWTADDVREVNDATPGTSKAFLGTRLEGVLKKETSTLSGVGHVDIDTDDTAVFITTSATAGLADPSLADSVAGHELTLVLVTDGGKDFIVSPTTKKGFASLTLDDANDSCTIKYTNDTDGWIVVGNAGCTIN
jgi:hypothetical protein